MTRPRRRLLIRPGAIGDFIVSLPALEALRGDYTEVWCAEQNVTLARFADHAISMGTSGVERLGFQPAERTIERLRTFDSIVSWHGANSFSFQSFTSKTLKLPITFLPALPDPGVHAVEFYRAQARSLGAKEVSRQPQLDCPPGRRTFAAIHPFASGGRKQAPIRLFQEAAARLAERMPVRWFRGPEDDLPGTTVIPDLWELACELAGARIFVGNDSGIAHLAAAVGTPVLALFPVSNPRQWTPRGPAVAPIRLPHWNEATRPETP